MEATNTVYNIKEAARELKVSVPFMYEIAKSKGFPSIRLGNRIVIPVDKFNEWLNKQCEDKVNG